LRHVLSSLSHVVIFGGLARWADFFCVRRRTSAFAVLPTRHLAGNVVARSITALHWMGIVSGSIFLASSLLYNRLMKGSAHVFAGRHILVVLMLALTLISQFGIIPRMDALRASLGEIDSVPADNPLRMQFDALHLWSTRTEEGVLLLGLALVYLTASAFSS
jgi:Domain of unknown function (DUF4149)